MIETYQVPYLQQRARDSWEKYKAIKKERSLLNARLEELKKAEAIEDNLLKTQFGMGCQFRRLVGGVLLTRTLIKVPEKVVTPEMVGTVVTKGYEYPIYKEIEG